MRSIVFSTVSHLDMYTGEDRKDRWRPLLELLRIHDFKVDRLYFFISHLYRHIVPTLVKDMNNVCPETEIVPVITNLNGVLTYEDIAPAYKVFSAYFEQYRFDLSNERYFFHLGPGNLFQHALMLIMLFHFKRLPFQMLRLAPNPEKPGDIIMEIYEGDIRKWIASIADSEKRNVAAQTFLKSCIETRNPVFNKLIEEMEHVATHSTAPVLLSGPTGSGKSHLARKIYELRYNKGLVPGSFVEVNCATLQGESVLSNLFGHVRGSFTGATAVRQGLLKTAHEGILFLDEIAEIPLQIQVILLKAIEEKKFYPFGSDTPVHSDFQLICGTNRDLAEEVRQGRFRLDLLSRINMWHFRLPPLRERLEDIEPNINYELDRHTRLKGFKADFLPEARERYLNFAMSPEAIWPGNFRDLSSSIERMQSYALGGIINEGLVEEEIVRLRAIWHTPALAELPAPKQGAPLLSRLFTASQLDQMDLFDKIQLENVIRVCCDCSTPRRQGVNCSAFRVAGKNTPTIRHGSTSISNRKASHGSRSSRCGTANADGLHGHCSRRLKKLRQGAGTASVMRGYFHDTSSKALRGKGREAISSTGGCFPPFGWNGGLPGGPP